MEDEMISTQTKEKISDLFIDYLNDIHQIISNGLNKISNNKEILKFEEYSKLVS